MGRVGRRESVRPTAQRVREALFQSLGALLPEAAVLDLYAGTGALGLEALARGARRVVFVERDPRLAARIREHVRREGWTARAQVWRAAVRTALRALEAAGERFDLVLLDPPYGRGLLQETLDALAGGALLTPGARVVAEGHWRDEPHPPPGLTCVRTARYGETRVWEYAARGPRGEEEAQR
ncbi:MAG: 16S rRNA (guanine(966)-N(2))-methyltransferase RsmD [Armatimonadota bacterium]|nr:16S rRNA (guanine(966)-N(2))-methyltransferase RsmD [Armatimonadota bacterium]MDR7427097.1 16S rRNA (guanine(966)-N(2))-methyltransferase RsmD [Armatimonadota bacterium]MDR7470033.1 16S rRNA (guanine(966)-N(2))-methyltransferase RsmD [Armatimonadota bacterium]MDR7474135.1 16S rRNA (guanine(966)-N(2))-methyltransferase RsmD [Armatimonadota bacterium]MDR7539382.1 16S rRNA (guanine(966)-N(2))-methyltransferase RsmD [Armatimonadota bacterium]